MSCLVVAATGLVFVGGANRNGEGGGADHLAEVCVRACVFMIM